MRCYARRRARVINSLLCVCSLFAKKVDAYAAQCYTVTAPALADHHKLSFVGAFVASAVPFSCLCWSSCLVELDGSCFGSPPPSQLKATM